MMTLFETNFEAEWKKLDEKYNQVEEIPRYIFDYADQIKNFMLPENRQYQGALGNAKGMLAAVKHYAEKKRSKSPQRFMDNVKLIFDMILTVRSTSQVPLNTAFFITQKLKQKMITNPSIEDLISILNHECTFHVENYKLAREKIAQAMAMRIIDRCNEYDQSKIVIGTHCHSGAVVKAIIKSKEYIKYVVVSKTEPEQQGILTAEKLCSAGIPVKLINLEQYSTAFRSVNMFLFGVDAVSVEGTVLNKTGTRIIATLAHTKELPVYFLGETYKYAQNTLFGGLIRVERRDVSQKLLFNHLGINLEKFVDQGLLMTDFQAFDTTKPEFYDSIVSEQGFLPMREAFEREWAEYLK